MTAPEYANNPFVPILSHFKEPVTLDMEVKGTVDQLTCSHLEITADDRQFRLRGDVSLQDLSHPQDAYVYGTLSELSANTRGVGFLVRNLNPNYNGVPPLLERLGNVSFQGEISFKVTCDGKVRKEKCTCSVKRSKAFKLSYSK